MIRNQQHQRHNEAASRAAAPMRQLRSTGAVPGYPRRSCRAQGLGATVEVTRLLGRPIVVTANTNCHASKRSGSVGTKMILDAVPSRRLRPRARRIRIRRNPAYSAGRESGAIYSGGGKRSDDHGRGVPEAVFGLCWMPDFTARPPTGNHRAAASALSSGRVLKAIAAPGAAL
jgi:hypothetical protein